VYLGSFLFLMYFIHWALLCDGPVEDMIHISVERLGDPSASDELDKPYNSHKVTKNGGRRSSAALSPTRAFNWEFVDQLRMQ